MFNKFCANIKKSTPKDKQLKFNQAMKDMRAYYRSEFDRLKPIAEAEAYAVSDNISPFYF